MPTAHALPVDIKIVNHSYDYPIDMGTRQIYRGMVVHVEFSPTQDREMPEGEALHDRLCNMALRLANEDNVDISSVRIVQAKGFFDRMIDEM